MCKFGSGVQEGPSKCLRIGPPLLLFSYIKSTTSLKGSIQITAFASEKSNFCSVIPDYNILF